MERLKISNLKKGLNNNLFDKILNTIVANINELVYLTSAFAIMAEEQSDIVNKAR